MRMTLPVLLVACLVFGKGTVEIPLHKWESLVSQVENASRPQRPDQAFCPIDRRIEGSFRKGLFRGVITYRFTVFDTTGFTSVPIVDGEATLGKVTLNGRNTSLVKNEDMFTVGIDRPGDYVVRAEMVWGKEMERFERELSFRVPEAGPTRLSLVIPEKDIEATLSNGALLPMTPGESGTRLEGYLDASGRVNLVWNRKLSHTVRTTVRSEAQQYTLFTLQEGLVSGQSQLQYTILEGETDRVDLAIPHDLEIIDVTGDAVLQWHTDRTQGNRLVVLLRHLVQSTVSMNVRFQFPYKEGSEIVLSMPSTDSSTAIAGALGILSTSALNVKIASFRNASELELRDLPPGLTAMSSSPFLYGFSFEEPPRIGVTVSRHADVALTETLIDELQATTIALEDGQEITKMKLRIRNNNRQYLRMELPNDARLTHSTIDGMSARPALLKEGTRDLLLFPLQQSEPVNSGEARYHTVREGETLSDIANRYYSDPSLWRFLLEQNAGVLSDAQDLTEGQSLFVPDRGGPTVRESSFLVELAYKREGKRRISFAGARSYRLPNLDVETVRATWHLFFPDQFEILSFQSNLTQLTENRYGPFVRLRDFLRNSLVVRSWAGGREYSNILVSRKQIYKADVAQRSREETVLSNFPLVGKKYRFKRDLLGTTTPSISLLYVPLWSRMRLQVVAFVTGAALTLGLLMRRRDRKSILLGIGIAIMLLVAGHFFMGVYRRLLWGVDVGLALALIRFRAPLIRIWIADLLQSPSGLIGLVKWSNSLLLLGVAAYLGLILMFPLYLSLSLAIVLSLAHRYWRVPVSQEVHHA